MHRISQQPLKPQKRLSGRTDSAQTLCRKAAQLGTMEKGSHRSHSVRGCSDCLRIVSESVLLTCRLCNSFETTDSTFQTLEEIFISVHFQDLSSVLLLETLQGSAHLSEFKRNSLLGNGLTRGKCKRQSPVSRSEGLEISQVVLNETLGQETRY